MITPDFWLGVLCTSLFFVGIYALVLTFHVRRGLAFAFRFAKFSGDRQRDGSIDLSGKFSPQVTNGASKPGLFAALTAGDPTLQDAIKRDQERVS